MKRFIKMLMVTCVAALALSAMAAAGASAATFTASATGTLTGTATTSQVFTVSEGGSSTVTCKKAHTTGTIVSTAATNQHVHVTYSECTANLAGFFNLAVDPITATYNLTANGEVHIVEAIIINVTGLGCKITVKGSQTVKSVTYTNKAGKLEQHSAVKGIQSTGEGFCPGGTTGTYTGSNLVERVGGGTLSWDA